MHSRATRQEQLEKAFRETISALSFDIPHEGVAIEEFLEANEFDLAFDAILWILRTRRRQATRGDIEKIGLLGVRIDRDPKEWQDLEALARI